MKAQTGTCQCTQCRRNSGSLALICVQIPEAFFRWLSPSATSAGAEPVPFGRPPSSLRTFSATPEVRRGFCATVSTTREQILFPTWKSLGFLGHVWSGSNKGCTLGSCLAAPGPFSFEQMLTLVFSKCGGFLFWREEGGPIEFCVGTIDPLFLVGPSDDPEVGHVDVDGNHIPEEGYGALLAGGYGRHVWSWNEIKGVTDDLAILGVGRGERVKPK